MTPRSRKGGEIPFASCDPDHLITPFILITENSNKSSFKSRLTPPALQVVSVRRQGWCEKNSAKHRSGVYDRIPCIRIWPTSVGEEEICH